MEITGTIKYVGAVQQSKNGNPFQEFVVEEVGMQYPASASLTIFGAKVQEFSGILRSGAMVTVKFDTRAREYQGRWFTSLSAWSVTLAEAAQPQAQAYQPQQAMPAQPYQPQQGNLPY